MSEVLKSLVDGYGIEDLVGTAGPGVTMLVFIAIPFLWSLPFGLVASATVSPVLKAGYIGRLIYPMSP